ncbi:hypothetical protein [Lentibacillus salicampi]|uniref:hypothetical protein n=1 Tax=Lentibacillus salicampi TaxID=175306 RepID=UPI001431CA8B|nr:hypothetical protein [Lentibacillus salicampi]
MAIADKELHIAKNFILSYLLKEPKANHYCFRFFFESVTILGYLSLCDWQIKQTHLK